MPKKVLVGGKIWEISNTEESTLQQVSYDERTRVRTLSLYRFDPRDPTKVLVRVSELPSDGGAETIVSQRFRPIEEFLLPKSNKLQTPVSWWNCNNPQTRPEPMVSPEPKKETSQENMSQNLYGVRVQAPDPGRPGRLLSGTVLSSPSNPDPRTQIFLLLDQQDSRFKCDSSRVGPGYGVILPRAGLLFLGARATDKQQTYIGTPPHLGVMAGTSFEQDGVRFPRGSTGVVVHRIWGRDIGETRSWIVNWYSTQDAQFHTIEEQGRTFPNCWSIRGNKPLVWCILDSSRTKVLWTFGAQGTSQVGKFKKGEYVVYYSDKPQHVNVNNAVYAVTRGTVLAVNGTDRDGCCLKTTLAGGCLPEALGTQLTVKTTAVQRLDATYFRRADEVKVVAEVVFRKRNFQGLVARVVLPTDQDGDVGVEFPEDIGAGSLDGVGKEGKCLYIPASALKKASE